MNANEKNIQAIGKYISEISLVSKWDLCTFNNMCVTKYRKLERQWELESSNLLTKVDASHLLHFAKLSVPHSVSVKLSGLTI
jgi:pyruvate-formate lyase-activating enzyme